MTARTASANAMSVAAGHRPAGHSPAPRARGDRDEEDRGDDHAADRGRDGQRRAAGFAQVSGDELGRPRTDQTTLANVATRHGVTVVQVALAWLLTASPVTLTIPGTSSLDHLAENVAAAALHLTTNDLAELRGERSPVEPTRAPQPYKAAKDWDIRR